MTSCEWGRTEGQIGFSGWTTSVYSEAINMQEGLIMHSLGEFLIPVGFRNSLESGDALELSLLSKATSPQVFTCCDLSGSFCFCHRGENRGFVPSLWRGVGTATGVGGGFPAEVCTHSSVTLSDFHVPFPISQITALYGWMFGGLVSVVLHFRLSFLLVSKRWVG